MRGIGVDVVDIGRFRATIERTPSIVDRLFTTAEREYSFAASDPAPRLAARFAAKEAVMKALGVGLGAMPMSEIEVLRDDHSGRPAVLLHGRAAEVAEEAGVVAWLLSLTHSDLVAQATAVAL